jgi:ribosomal protein S18 acetylase RimI-like enzyme
MKFEIVPFDAGLIPQAAVLLAERHRRDRAVLPELPPRFEDPAAARAAIEATWRRTHGDGVAALHGGQLLGYLIGDMALDPVWGRSAWVRLAGCALAAGQSAELVRDLYAVLGARWVTFGCFAHFALVPTADPALVHAWFALTFGIEQVHALLALDGLDLSTPAPPRGVEIRRAGPQDRETLADLSDVIWRHQVQAPVWGIHLPEDEAEARAGWADLGDDPTVTVWLALRQGQVVGCQGYFPAEPSDDDLLLPEQCTRLTIAGTRETARGQGIGQALTRHGLAHARDSGYRYCETDWRSTNLLSSRFWPRQGFRPVAYRLVRRIDPRIAWANGQ